MRIARLSEATRPAPSRHKTPCYNRRPPELPSSTLLASWPRDIEHCIRSWDGVYTPHPAGTFGIRHVRAEHHLWWHLWWATRVPRWTSRPRRSPPKQRRSDHLERCGLPLCQARRDTSALSPCRLTSSSPAASARHSTEPHQRLQRSPNVDSPMLMTAYSSDWALGVIATKSSPQSSGRLITGGGMVVCRGYKPVGVPYVMYVMLGARGGRSVVASEFVSGG